MPAELRGRALSKVFPGGVSAVDGVDVTAEKNAVTALVGKNGAGKSTLLAMLAGAMVPSSGVVERQKGRSSYLTQDVALDPEMTGAETLRLMAALYGVKLNDVAKRLGIDGILRRPVATYSGGQKRRLHLACALLHDPEIIFLDEPTAGLDADGTRILWSELRGLTVVVAGHDLAEIEREAASVVILDRGKVLAAGSPASLIAEHGRAWLAVTLENPDDAIVERVNALPGFSHATLKGRRLDVEADDPDRAGQLLAAIGAVRDITVHRRDLASVYRALTGNELRK
jgi:ABC-2 type transport system ATP-binding protein